MAEPQPEVPAPEITDNAAEVKENAEVKLPKLSPADFRLYNRMAEHMDQFHSHFRSTWNVLYNACKNGRKPQGMSIKQFLSTAEEFCHHLTMHHTIEEMHIFPVRSRDHEARDEN